MNLALLFLALTFDARDFILCRYTGKPYGWFCLLRFGGIIFSQHHNKLSNCHDSFIHSTAKKKKVNRSLVRVACEGQFSFHSESSVSHPEYFLHDSKSSLNHPSANKGLKIFLYWRFQLTSRIEASQSNTLHSIRKVSLMCVL